jgi:hypothetical protein
MHFSSPPWVLCAQPISSLIWSTPHPSNNIWWSCQVITNIRWEVQIMKLLSV